MRGYRTWHADPAPRRRRCATTPAAHPERPARIAAIDARAGATRLARAPRCASRSPVALDDAARRAPAEPTSSASARRPSRGRRRARRRHGRVGRLLRGGAARRGRRGRAGRRAARRRGGGPARRCTARQATTPRPRGRWASACSTTSPWRASTRSTPTALERVLVLDWDVHHGNGTNDIFHADPRVLFVSLHERRCTRARARRRRSGLGRGRGLHGQPAGAGRVGRRRRGARWSSTSSSPLARAYGPELVLLSAGFDAHARDPLADCEVTDAGFAQMARHGAAAGRRVRRAGRRRARGRLRPARRWSGRCWRCCEVGGRRARRPRAWCRALRALHPLAAAAGELVGAWRRG